MLLNIPLNTIKILLLVLCVNTIDSVFIYMMTCSLRTCIANNFSNNHKRTHYVTLC